MSRTDPNVALHPFTPTARGSSHGGRAVPAHPAKEQASLTVSERMMRSPDCSVERYGRRVRRKNVRQRRVAAPPGTESGPLPAERLEGMSSESTVRVAVSLLAVGLLIVVGLVILFAFALSQYGDR